MWKALSHSLASMKVDQSERKFTENVLVNYDDGVRG